MTLVLEPARRDEDADQEAQEGAHEGALPAGEPNERSHQHRGSDRVEDRRDILEFAGEGIGPREPRRALEQQPGLADVVALVADGDDARVVGGEPDRVDGEQCDLSHFLLEKRFP